MFNISDFLKKFTKIEGDSKLQQDVIARALAEIGITHAKIKLQKGILYVTAAPAAKTALYMKKAALIARIEKELPQMKILDIR
jgi:hypothetical protein